MVTIGPYRATRLLDRAGGVSRYLAAHEGREVTLCVCDEPTRDPGIFQQRLDVLRRLPEGLPVVRVLDGGVSELGLWAVWERPRGRTLARVFEGRRTYGEQFYAAQTVLSTIRALTAVHDGGAVHGGINVHGVLLVTRDTADPEDVIDDVGLPWLMGAPVALSACYRAPEHFTAPAALDCRTDVYGVGVLLFELLSGLPPFHGADAEALRDCVMSIPLRPHEAIPSGMWEVIDRATAKDPAERYDDLRALRAALVRAITSGLHSLLAGTRDEEASGRRPIAVARSGDSGRVSEDMSPAVTLRSSDLAGHVAPNEPATRSAAPLAPPAPAPPIVENFPANEEEPVTLPWVPQGRQPSPATGGEAHRTASALPWFALAAGLLGLAAGAGALGHAVLGRPVVIVQPPAQAIHVAPIPSVAPTPAPTPTPTSAPSSEAVAPRPVLPPARRDVPTATPRPAATVAPLMPASSTTAAPSMLPAPPAPAPPPLAAPSGKPKQFAWEISDPCALSWYRCAK
ncbi:MAG TPA: hypothetical protein VLS89_17850 [Candidatus Nanopelagicales bacterium]|nr:hypothetical protein [Candidatus Nanopelagicales bacterium]